jgi:hypothetical protein
MNAARTNLDMLQRLAAERPQQTVEELALNDFYGHADLLKRYTGISRKSPLRAIIEHGSRLGDTNWDNEVDAPYFIYFTWSHRRFPTVQAHADKACFSLGPLIEYAPPVRPDRLQKFRTEYGRNLLFFPSHSTHWVDANHNIDSICTRLKNFNKDFNTIRICMYWRDIQRGMHHAYVKHGFPVECAGHMYDKHFYTRLRELIETATVTASMTIGSCIGHSLSLNRPYWHLEEPVEFTSNHSTQFEKIDQAIQQRTISKTIREQFQPGRYSITPEQRVFAVTAFGLGQKKSPEALTRIITLGQEIWTLSKNPADNGNRLLGCMMLAKSLEHLFLNNLRTATQLTAEALKMAPGPAKDILAYITREGRSRSAQRETAS